MAFHYTTSIEVTRSLTIPDRIEGIFTAKNMVEIVPELFTPHGVSQ